MLPFFKFKIMYNPIPKQQTGASSDTISSVELDTSEAAQKHYEIVKARFLDINNWDKYAGEEKANFTLTSKDGKTIHSAPEVGNLFRITIPGPGNPSGDGDDWVQVEDIKHQTGADCESIAIRVRPAASPLDPSDETAHFYNEKATSTFIVKREKQTVTAEVHGRNEEPNNEDVNLLAKVRNTIVAIGGILAGSKFQWKALTKGLVSRDEQ